MKEDVLVLNVLEGNLTTNVKGIISLMMDEVIKIKTSENNKEKHVLSDKNIAGIIIDMRDIPEKLPEADKIKKLMFITTACKSLQNLEIVFAGNQKQIRKHFDFLKADMVFIEAPQQGIDIFLN